VSAEAHRSFACFGGTATVHVRAENAAVAEEAVERARRQLLDGHRRLTRFEDGSELCRLNRDPRAEVPASPLLRRLAAAVAMAGARSGGLVDATLLGSLERAGYGESMERVEPTAPGAASRPRSPTGPAGPDPAARWSLVVVDEQAGTVLRPPGVRIDSGGIAKGLLADLVGTGLAGHAGYAVDCCGDVRVGGSASLRRRVGVGDPRGGDPIHELALRDGAVATSGVARRRWTGPAGESAHHIIDPRSGEPAFTGIAQATALAPDALLAEVYAKAALLSGPEGAAEWLPHGGVLVRDDGAVEVLAPSAQSAERVAAIH
jgi:thiamine biosynthesis lipoprotein